VIVLSAFQAPLTARETTESINEKKYLLPAIQREFIWGPDRIVRLFDSLMQGYPIGSFLFWNVGKEKLKQFQFYEFVRNYHERDNRHNPKANVSGKETLTAVLDGQQRLTSIYVGLKGTFASKVSWKRWDNPEAFPTKKLYLNLLSKSSEPDMLYDFRFLTPLEAVMRDEKNYWFEVGKILDFSGLRDITKYLRSNGLIEYEFAEDCLHNLYEAVNEKRVINFYLENSQDLDKVLTLFIRVNTGGVPLRYSDMLLSIAAAQWKTKDAREEIIKFVDEINRIGGGAEPAFDKDFVLKSCLVLADIPDIAFKVDNFNVSNMSKIENKWESIMKALRISVELVSSFGYDNQTLTATYAVIPIAYFMLNLDKMDSFVQSSRYREDRKRIGKWLKIALIKRSFSGQPDNVLRPIRKILSENPAEFPYYKIVDNFKGTNKSLTFAAEDIESLLDYEYGESHTFSVLSLLYPTLDFKNRFHQDHIHPRSFFKPSELRKKQIPEEQRELYLKYYDHIGNLQLLEGVPNEEKSNTDFKTWLEKTYPDKNERREYMQRHFIPMHVGLGFENFMNFYEARNKLLLEKLKEALA
jgi:uncharacterized protein with ParB-like and HNH nuclease domain